MVVKSFLVAMCRWRSVISHWQAILLMALLSAVQVSSQQPTYTFSETSNPVRICPVVEASDVNPSLVVRPSSSDPAFLTGQYTYPTSGTTSERFIFPPPCNDSPCTELSIRYNPSSPPARDSFNVDYAGSEGSGQATIQIDYATKGIYLQKPGVVLRPVDGSENLDQGMLVYLGDLSPPFITCHVENQTEARVVVAINIGGYEKCATSVGGGGQPTFLELRYDPGLAMGTHRLYTAAGGNCSSDQRSEEFIVSFESPPPTTPEPEVTTTSDIGETGSPGDNNVAIISGVVAGVIFLVAMVVAVIGAVYLYRYIQHKNKWGKRRYGNGAASPFVHGDPEATQIANHNGTSNGHVPARPSLECIYIGGKHYEKLEESLAECHGVELKRLDNNIVSIRAALSRHDCIVYIIQDSAPEDERNAFVTELESMPSNESHRTHVFLILFKSDEQHTIQRQYYYILARAEDPSSDMFSSSSCAEDVVNEVKSIRGEDRQHESAESSETGRTGNFPDGEGNVVVRSCNEHLDVRDDQQSDDKGTLEKLLKEVAKVGNEVAKVSEKVNDAKKTIVDEVRSTRGEDQQQELVESSELHNSVDAGGTVADDKKRDDMEKLADKFAQIVEDKIDKAGAKVVAQMGDKVDKAGVEVVAQIREKVEDATNTLQGGQEELEERLNELSDGRNKIVRPPLSPD